MDLMKIRNMNDEELTKFLRGLTSKNKADCYVCDKRDAKYVIYVKNNEVMQQRKLCALCEKHYNEILDHIGICDINW